MKKNYRNLSADEFSKKFSTFILHKKKLRALENYASCYKAEKSKYLPLLKECLEDGFLEEEEETFLEHLLEKCELKAKYLLWMYNTRWLKKQKASAYRETQAKQNQIYLDLFKNEKIPSVTYPVEMIRPQVTYQKGLGR